ncbi:hypothetical protein [Trinickia soli]|uniref:hypothetical protein n=1 Tax=Trinickia soli TaxID=380675 RepID=UPI001255BB46|nr:hypothetical protein CIW54_19010 [Paraburkholderia sp. T12-10]
MQSDHLIALGDSHLEALKFAADLRLLDVGSNCFEIVPGATVVGLRNPNSLTDAVNIFKRSLLSQPVASHVLIHLGEVDCGFVMWWRAKKMGESVEVQLKESLYAYRQFLSELMESGFDKICVTGASLPTIRDGIDMGQVSNKRSEIVVGIRERTELTSRYNAGLKELAAVYRLSYFDFCDVLVDRETRVVHDFFRNPDPTDHHLDKTKIVAIWADKCNSFVNGLL